MTHGGRRRLGRWLGALAVAVAAALLVTATPAQAAPVNNVYFNSNVVDFGTNLDPFAFTLRDPGTLTFERVGNGYRPRLWGAVLMKELNGFCGRMGLDYYDASNTLIGSLPVPPSLTDRHGEMRRVPAKADTRRSGGASRGAAVTGGSPTRAG